MLLLESQGTMKILPLFVVLLSVASIKSTTFPGCDILINGVSMESSNKYDLKDDAPIGRILELTSIGVDEFTLKPDSAAKYFQLKPFISAESTIELSLSDAYTNVEQELPSSNTETVLQISFNVKCSSNTETFYIDYSIIDNNNQPTVLSSGDIQLKIPLPFPVGIPLHLLVGNDELTASDADISNDIITFQLDPSNVFQISGEKDDKDTLGKTYLAIITPIHPLSNYETQTFKVTAKDKDGIASAEGKLTIAVDIDASIPAPPKFKDNYYTGEYKIDDGIHSLTPLELELTNVANTHIILPKFEDGEIDFTEFLNLEYVIATKSISLTLIKDLTLDILEEYDSLSVWISASIEGFDINPSTVSVLITLPPKGQNGNQAFTESVYNAQYNVDTNEVQLSEDIIVTLPNIVIEIEGDFATNFDAKPNAENPLLIDVTVSIPLSPAEIAENDYISLTLTAKVVDDNYGSTVVIINLPAEECPTNPPIDVFTQTLYKGTYEVPSTGDHSITMEVIALDPTEVLRVFIEPNDYPLNFQIQDDDINDIKIVLILQLGEDFLKNNEIVSLILVAKNTDGLVYGSTVVIIDLPPGKCDVNPIENVFGEVLYEGKYVEPEQGTPIVTFVKTITATSEEPLEIVIIDGSANFVVNFDNAPNVDITVSEPIPEEIIKEKKFITLVLSAKGIDNANEYGKTALTIELPTRITKNVFDREIYNGIYVKSEVGTDSVVFETTITTSSTDALLVQFHPDDEFASHFKIDDTSDPPKVLLTVETDLGEDVFEKDFITLTLIAKSTDGTIDYGNTVLVIDLPQECSLEPSDDIFVKIVFDGKYEVSDDGVHTVSTEIISVINDGTIVSLEGEYANNFKVEVTPDKEVKLTIEEDLNENVWINNGYISILMQGSSDVQTGAARIILDLPDPDCPNPEGITFLDTSYYLKPTHQGLIGTLVATLVPEEKHTFTISHQPSWVVLTGAELFVDTNSKLEPGTYTIKATVTVDESKKSANAVVTIYVKSNVGGRTEFSMKVIEIDEETKLEDILNLDDDGGYEYKIQRQEPETDPRLFTIEEIDKHKFLTTTGVDREDTIFNNLQIPQIVLTLVLQAIPASTNIRSLLAVHPLFKYIPKYQSRNSQELKTCLMLDTTILREDSTMHVPIIIKDKNDKSPEFVETSIVVGYPTKDIVFDINPQYLMKVEAIDADEGVNAMITYASTSTSVKVNTNTGIVYPTEGLYNGAEEETIIITASDGLNNAEPPLTAKILLLDKDHMSLLIFTNILLEDLESTLDALSTDINVSLRYLSAGSLPVQSADATRADSDVYLKAVIYGIENNDVAITHTNLKDKLAGKPVSVIEYTPATDCTGGKTDPEECDDTGLIAGIAVLAVALVICICTFIVFYIKKKKNNASLDLEQLPEHKTSFKKSNASQNGYDSDVVLKNVATRRPTQYPMEAPKLDDDNKSNSNASSDDEEDFDEARERRKSVTFNEKTEHFVITKENESAKADNNET